MAKRVAEPVWAMRGDGPDLEFARLFAPVEHLLAHGGDARLTLSPMQLNMYGCAPFPRAELIDYASSTASSISQEAYERVQTARRELLTQTMVEDAASAFDARMDAARAELSQLLGLQADTDIVFAASGTDAQLQALFLTKALLDAPLTSIIVGADQTGSGTANTARGRHFGDVTAGGHHVEKGRPIEGIASQVASIEIPFRNPEGGFHTPAEMDRAVIQAILQAINTDSTVLLQIMDASKLGWQAPTDACVEEIARRWPGQVQIVVDACQFRTSRDRLVRMLANGFLVLLTGSKFFTGPAFSGALLVPGSLAAKIAARKPKPGGLSAYTTRYDWPAGWTWLREHLSAKPNFGQWLRWQAALEEMRLYYAVPDDFCADLRTLLAEQIERSFLQSPHLKFLPAAAGMNDITIFAAVPHRNGKNLSWEACAEIYRAMERDCSSWITQSATDAERRAVSRPCQIGQPVALADGAALRFSISARIVRRCWSPSPEIARQKIAEEIENCRLLFAKLDFLIGHLEDARSVSGPFLLEDKWDNTFPARLGLAAILRRGGTAGALRLLWEELAPKLSDDPEGAAVAMDLSLVSQLLQDKATGLAIQNDALALQQVFRLRLESPPSGLRILALAAASDIGANTPIEFLLENSGAELATYYVVPGMGAPDMLPDHDVAIVIASPAEDATLKAIESLTAFWPRPLLNPPALVSLLERDSLCRRLEGVAGLTIPGTMRVTRAALAAMAGEGGVPDEDILDPASPFIVRPVGSHGGVGLEKLVHRREIKDYLERRAETDFFVSPYVDYSGDDGLFRKYRVALIGGRPFASHMAISEEWKVWYLSADMALNVAHRVEEACWMEYFDQDFAMRHANALAGFFARTELDYIVIDCAETRDGKLLIFEADNGAIVHDMDPPGIFPYKSAHMQKLFKAFVEMLSDRAAKKARCAA